MGACGVGVCGRREAWARGSADVQRVAGVFRQAHKRKLRTGNTQSSVRGVTCCSFGGGGGQRSCVTAMCSWRGIDASLEAPSWGGVTSTMVMRKKGRYLSAKALTTVTLMGVVSPLGASCFLPLSCLHL